MTMTQALRIAATILGLAAGTQIEAGLAQTAFTREPERDRSGNDIVVEALDVTADAGLCEALCRARVDCVAYTFVKRSDTVPKPLCRLKDERPYPHESSCCISGERRE